MLPTGRATPRPILLGEGLAPPTHPSLTARIPAKAISCRASPGFAIAPERGKSYPAVRVTVDGRGGQPWPTFADPANFAPQYKALGRVRMSGNRSPSGHRLAVLDPRRPDGGQLVL